MVGFCVDGNETTGSKKRRGISRSPERLLAFQHAPCCVELVGWLLIDNYVFFVVVVVVVLCS